MRKPFLQPHQPAIGSAPIDSRLVLTVSQLNRQAKNLMESELGSIWLEGEISNYVAAASGHWYFTLKDSQAQIKCAMFKFKNRRLSMTPAEGDKVVVKGSVSLYEARGDYQLICDFMEPAGMGRLQQELNRLIKKLDAKGLFSQSDKKPLPFLPQRIGVITSKSGAAIHDVLSVLERRCPMVPVIIYPTQVQGQSAADTIIAALKKAETRNECDVLLITRGGGSLEDLWSFNNERLAEAIHQCATPIVAAIGHEVDTTITELVADLRAPTPSAAAELMVPEQQVLWQKVDQLNANLQSSILQIIGDCDSRLELAKAQIKDPENTLLQSKLKLSQLYYLLNEAIGEQLSSDKENLLALETRLSKQNPATKLLENQFRLKSLNEKMISLFKRHIASQKHRFILSAEKLHALSPLSTLTRGYSITKDKHTGKVITRAAQVEARQELVVRLSEGEIAVKAN